MKLYLSPTSPFARLCVIAALRAQKKDLQLEFVIPWENPEQLLNVHPYGQVPALQCDDGRILSESLIIMQQLDGSILADQPEKSAFGLTTLNMAAKTFGLEAHGDKEHPHPHINRGKEALRRALARAPQLNAEGEGWGDVILGVGLSYAALRLPEIYAAAVSAEQQEAVKRFEARDFMQKSRTENLQNKPATVADL